jgi:hypothetical protein
MFPKGMPGHVRMRRQHLLITAENGYLAPLSTISGVHCQAGIATMNRSVAVVFGVVVVAGLATANGQEPNPQPPSVDQVAATGQTGFASSQDRRQSHPLFTLGWLGVSVWAPLEPHYNVEANRNLAGQSIWGAE